MCDNLRLGGDNLGDLNRLLGLKTVCFDHDIAVFSLNVHHAVGKALGFDKAFDFAFLLDGGSHRLGFFQRLLFDGIGGLFG